MLNIKKLIRSFQRATLGLVQAIKEEQNFRIQLIFAIIVITTAIFFRISSFKIAILILAVAILLILELVNSLVERMIDLLKPRLHHYVAIIKDLMSAAVLIAGLTVIVITILIFWPYLFV